MIGRRRFITHLGGLVVLRPLSTGAQQPITPIIGFLNNLSPDAIAHPVSAFREGLKEAGYVEGRTVAIEYRWAESQNDRLPELAADLVRRRVMVIVATGGGASALAAKAASTTIPTVFSSATDPVELGLVASLNRPGGNATGVHVMTNSLEAKRLGLLHELVPNAATIAVLVNPGTPGADSQLVEVETAGRAIARKVHIVKASKEPELAEAFLPKPELAPSSLPLTPSSMLIASRSSRLRSTTRFPRPTSSENSSQPAD